MAKKNPKNWNWIEDKSRLRYSEIKSIAAGVREKQMQQWPLTLIKQVQIKMDVFQNPESKKSNMCRNSPVQFPPGVTGQSPSNQRAIRD